VNRRTLAETPLHMITRLYGEPGLRMRFIHEALGIASDDEFERMCFALELAAWLHSADRRQREPYINHPLRVALRIIGSYQVRDTDVICAALLHDTVEDHAQDLSSRGQPGALGVLAEMFGPRVAELVAAVTNPSYEGVTDRALAYREHLAASLDTSPWARVIKVSDFTDNGVGLHYTSGMKAIRLARKYAPVVPLLGDLVDRADTPLSADVKAGIHDQLGRAERRFAAIIAAVGFAGS
jgi:(p)ppGpp synthase/HD superfamily hydrolase